jgi:hypothetical protein
MELERHEVGPGPAGAEGRGKHGIESEPAIVVRITENQNGLDRKRSAAFDACFHQLRADSLAAIWFGDRQRGELHGSGQTWRDGHRAEPNLTGDATRSLGNERKQQIAFVAQILDELAVRFARKCLIEQGAYFRIVRRSLVADPHRG